MQLQKKKVKVSLIKRLQKNFIKKKSIALLKFTKKLKFLAILEIYLQLRTKIFYKSSINNNNRNIIKLIDNKILNNLTKLFTSFEGTKHKLFINKKISVKT